MIRLTLSLSIGGRPPKDLPARLTPLCLACLEDHQVALWTVRGSRRPCVACGTRTRLRAYQGD